LTHVWLFEEYVPAHFNLTEDLYRRRMGSEKPNRRFWRLRGEFGLLESSVEQAAPGAEARP
jgi:hypothetical protein